MCGPLGTTRGAAIVVRVLVRGSKIVQANFIALSNTLVTPCLIVECLVDIRDVVQTAELVGACLCAFAPPVSWATKLIVRTWPATVAVGRIARTDSRSLFVCFDQLRPNYWETGAHNRGGLNGGGEDEENSHAICQKIGVSYTITTDSGWVPWMITYNSGPSCRRCRG